MRRLLGLTAAGAMLIASIWLVNSDREAFVVTAHFQDAVGLHEGNVVSVLGMPIGEVTDIEVSGDSVRVELTIDPGTELPADVNAVTVSPSVVTDRHVELTPPYIEGAKLADGDLIPLDRTRTPVEIDRVFNAANDLAEALRKQGAVAPLSGLVDNSAQFFGGRGDEVRKAIDGLAAAAEVGLDGGDDLTDLIRNVDLLGRTAVANDKLIRSFSGNVTEIMEVVAGEGPAIADSLAALAALLDEVDGFLGENRAGIRKTLVELKGTVSTVSNRSREVADATSVLPLIFQNAARVTDPRTGVARGHGLLDETVLQTEVLKVLCPTIPALPMCLPGAGRLGPDGGIFELMLGIVEGLR